MPSWGPLSLLEGIRLVLVLVGAVAATWGYLHAADGLLAFARPLRTRMRNRRRQQMAGYCVGAVAIGAETIIAALTPDPATLSTPALGVNLVLIVILIRDLWLVIMQAGGWVGLHELLAGQPLIPSIEDATGAGRELGHLAMNELTIIVGVLEIMSQEPGLSPERRLDVETAIRSAETAAGQIRALHQQIRDLDPTWKASA
jgi:hypothetical protein